MYQTENDIKIVNHQVPHHIDICSPFNKGSHTTTFNETGGSKNACERAKGGIETLQVTDL